MMNTKLNQLGSRLFVLCAACTFATGCGSLNHPSPENGNWVASFSLPVENTPFQAQGTFAMAGIYDKATGISHISGLPCISPDTPIPVKATQDVLSLATTWTTPINSATTLIVDGTQTSDLSTINGTFSVNGTDCGGLTAGNFVAKKYTPVSGQYQGSLVTSQGNTFSFLTSLEQSESPDEGGRYPVSGSASILPNQCIDNLALANSYVTGNTFSYTYAGNTSTKITVAGTLSMDASTMLIESFSISGGTCDGLTAAGTITRISSDESSSIVK